MALSLQARFWRMFLRKMYKPQRLTIAGVRARAKKNGRMIKHIPQGVEIEKCDIEGITVAWISVPGAEPEMVVLHLHGGGYVSSSLDDYLMMCILMAQTLQMKVLVPEYRLAPENPFPAALEDALKVYRCLLAQGHKSSDIIISGDSAGGGLSLATVLALRDGDMPLPAAVVVMSPWADLTFRGQSHVTKAKAEAMLQTDVLHEWAACYAGKEKPEHPLISPAYADFHGFPPLLIQVGSEEILLNDALMLAEKAKADGVVVTIRIWEGMWHVWQVLGALIPESRKAFEEMGAFVRFQ